MACISIAMKERLHRKEKPKDILRKLSTRKPLSQVRPELSKVETVL